MKKITLWGVLALAGMFTAFTACKKDEQKEPLSAGSAMVSGRLTANLDETDFQLQSVPSGTGVTFRISGADLDRNPQPGYNYEDVIVRGTTDANGNYSVSLPAVKKSINATVIFDEFEFDATVLTTNDDGFQEAIIERRTFTRANATISIVEGQVLVKDYNYNTGIGSFVPSAMIRGVVEAQINDNFGTPSNIALVDAGTNYTNNTDVAVSGGSGSGMTVNTFTNMAGDVTNVFINTAGSGYTIGDVLTIQDGDNNATFEITNVNAIDISVPEGVVLTFTVGGQPYKVVTDPNGEYLVKLPSNQGNAQLSGADFETASTYFEGGSYVNGPKIYSFTNPGNQTLTEGGIIELDLNYFRSN